MADCTWRTIHTARKEYSLPSPTNWAEVGKVFAMLRNELDERKAAFDDAVTVEARDGEIVFWYEQAAKGDPGTVTVSAVDLRAALRLADPACTAADRKAFDRLHAALVEGS